MAESLPLLRPGWSWLMGSVFVGIVLCNLGWLFLDPNSKRFPQVSSGGAAQRFAPWASEGLRMLYYVGLPSAALFWGHDAVIGRIAGLQPLALPFLGTQFDGLSTSLSWTDWTRDAGWAVATATGAWALLALGGWTYYRALRAASETSLDVSLEVSGWALLREAAYDEVHWTFYRNMPIVVFGVYWGVWIGLAIAAAEASFCPPWRHKLTNPKDAPLCLAQTAFSVTSAVFYLLTQNLWLAILVHWIVTWGVAQMMQPMARALQQEDSGAR